MQQRATATIRGLLLLLGAAPFALPLALARTAASSPWRQLDLLFVIVCHQKPERSLAIAGTLMPVCSRCAGIFAGLFTGALFAWPRLSQSKGRLGLLAAGALMLLDVVLQDVQVHPLWHSTRLATGWLLGHAATVVFLSARARSTQAQSTTSRPRASAAKSPDHEA
jgi:uncharacterized membrane protein